MWEMIGVAAFSGLLFVLMMFLIYAGGSGK